MTLSKLLTYCKRKCKNKTVRVFAGCMTLYNGNPSTISTHEWVKLHPYFNCKVIDRKVIGDTIVVTI